MLPLYAPRPSALVLYDPTETSGFGTTGRQEAEALANNRGIPLENVLEIPVADTGSNPLRKAHSGHVIIITHGNEGSGFTTATLRSGTRIRETAANFVRLLKLNGLFSDRNLPYRFELIICASASGNNTFARQFYDAAIQEANDVRVKAPIGLASVDAGGGVSVTYVALASEAYSTPSALGYALARTVGWALLSPIRALTNRLPDPGSNPVTSSNLLLHDWYFYPIGTSF
jgi:hypothetical protein